MIQSFTKRPTQTIKLPERHLLGRVCGKVTESPAQTQNPSGILILLSSLLPLVAALANASTCSKTNSYRVDVNRFVSIVHI